MHRIVKYTRAAMAAGRRDRRGFLKADPNLVHVPISASDGMLERVYENIETIVAAVESIGGTFRRARKSYYSKNPLCYSILVSGAEIDFSFWEGASQIDRGKLKKPRFEFIPTGRLQLSFHTRWSPAWCLSDTEFEKIEPSMHQIPLRLVELVKTVPREERAKLSEKIDVPNIGQPFLIDPSGGRALRDEWELFRYAFTCWEKAKDMREFLDAVEQKHRANLSPKLADWLKRCRDTVSKFDPLENGFEPWEVGAESIFSPGRGDGDEAEDSI